MKKQQSLKHSIILQTLAVRHGKTTQEITDEMEKALNAAWNTRDPAIQSLQKELFPQGKPTTEEFINTIATYMK